VSDIIYAASIAASAVVLTQISLHILERWKTGQDVKKEDLKARRERDNLADARRYEMKKVQYGSLLVGLSDSASNLTGMLNASGEDLARILASDEARRALVLKDLIANREILLLSTEAGDALGNATFSMLAIKTEELKARTIVESLYPQIQALLQKSNHASELMTGLRAQGRSETIEHADLERHFDEVHSMLAPMIAKQQEMAQERMHHLAAMTKLLFEVQPLILEKIGELKIAAREDLGFEMDDKIASAIRNEEGQNRLKMKAQQVTADAHEALGFPNAPNDVNTK